MPLPLQHVPVLRTVLPQDTTLAGALEYVVALIRAVGDPLVPGETGLHHIQPHPELHVVNADYRRYPKWQPGVVQELADYMDWFVESVRSKQDARGDKTVEQTEHHNSSIKAKVAMIEQKRQAAEGNDRADEGKRGMIEQKRSALGDMTNTLMRPSKRHRHPSSPER